MRSVESPREARRAAPTSIGFAIAAALFGFFSPRPTLSQQPLGIEFTVNQYLPNYQHTPRIACSAIGRCIVTFYDLRSDTEGHISGALLAEDGGAVVRQRFLEEPIADSSPAFSSVAWVNPEAAWVMLGRNFVYEPAEIRVRPFDSELRELGPESAVSDETGIQYGEFAVQTDGRLGVGFVRGEGASPGLGVRFQMADGTAQPFGPSVGVSQDPPCSGCTSTFPDVATNQAGEFVVVWQEDEPLDGSGAGVFGRRFNREGIPLGPAFGLATFTLGDQLHPAVTMDGQGNFVAVWMGGYVESFDILARRFDQNGLPLGPEFVVNEETHDAQTFPDVSGDLYGNWVVAWESVNVPLDAYREIWVRAFRPDGTPAGDDVHVNPDPSDDALEDFGQQVSLSDSGTFTVAWTTYFADANRAEDTRAARFVMPCVEDASTACLDDGRFQVRALWHAASRGYGTARVRESTDETAILTFFGDDTLEIVAKVLDGCGTNGRFWVYAAGLTDVETTLLVTDTTTGAVWSNVNPNGTVHPAILDTGAIDGCGVNAATSVDAAPASPNPATSKIAGLLGEHGLSLARGRYEITATFTAPGEATGSATPVPLSDSSGAFWFFGEENLELVVKLVDVCAELGEDWFYVAGLTNLEVELTVLDVASGEERRYRNPQGRTFLPIRESFPAASCGGGH